MSEGRRHHDPHLDAEDGHDAVEPDDPSLRLARCAPTTAAAASSIGDVELGDEDVLRVSLRAAQTIAERSGWDQSRGDRVVTPSALLDQGAGTGPSIA
jgi:hypothetical protein